MEEGKGREEMKNETAVHEIQAGTFDGTSRRRIWLAPAPSRQTPRPPAPSALALDTFEFCGTHDSADNITHSLPSFHQVPQSWLSERTRDCPRARRA